MDKEIRNPLERLEKILKPQRMLHEQIDRLIEPQRRLQEQMDKYLEPQRRLQEQMEKYLEPQRRLQEQMDKYLEPQHRLQEQLEKYLEPQRRLQEQMEKYLEPQRRLQEQMEKYLEPQRQLQEQLNKYLEPQRLLQTQISKYLNPLSDYLSNPLMESIAIGNDGTITVSNEFVDLNEVNESIESISKEFSNTDEFLEHLFSLLGKLTIGVRVVFLYLVLPYIIAIVANLTTPVHGEWWREYAELDKRIAKKEIIREANTIYSSEELSDIRFVFASVLNVRETGSTNSKIIGDLHLGKTVRLITKSKSWSFVEYEDSETGSIKQGWVFSRYLQKFTR